jgi:DNA-binding NtrC family response regulator
MGWDGLKLKNYPDLNMKSNEIIIVEDNDTMRLGMVEALHREGYQIYEFDNAPKALGFFKKNITLLVISDLKMEPLDGIGLLNEIKKINPSTEVIMVSAYGTVETAVKAMQLGATDFLTKPFSTDELRIRVRKVIEKIEQNRNIDQLTEENRLLQDDLFKDIIGNSPPMQRLFELINRVAREETTVLIEGESGTGKELVARAIHRKSPRVNKPFIKLNCGALNDNLLESELFGHEKGAFTGAIRQKKGRFELADGGTLFLDEIGDISPAMQVKLLRVLQEKEFERVGGEQTISVDVRLVSATNSDLKELIMQNRFREDLYYRLSVIPVKLPALRERKEDIPLLTEHFLNSLNGRRPNLKKYISSAGIQLLSNYHWPGNIRELENLIERLFVISPGPEIPAELIALHLSGHPKISTDADGLLLDTALESFEKKLILNALKKSDGIKNRAAKLLGIRTSTLYYKLEKYGIIK